ncbi:G2/mitotic-specific cyclin [Blastocladiella emersonii ATCC 22665]|nr:G2/mitotic-specific cyclin [Blastocladiella emersonii ATCC 22665]
MLRSDANKARSAANAAANNAAKNENAPLSARQAALKKGSAASSSSAAAASNTQKLSGLGSTLSKSTSSAAAIKPLTALTASRSNNSNLSASAGPLSAAASTSSVSARSLRARPGDSNIPSASVAAAAAHRTRGLTALSSSATILPEENLKKPLTRAAARKSASAAPADELVPPSAIPQRRVTRSQARSSSSGTSAADPVAAAPSSTSTAAGVKRTASRAPKQLTDEDVRLARSHNAENLEPVSAIANADRPMTRSAAAAAAAAMPAQLRGLPDLDASFDDSDTRAHKRPRVDTARATSSAAAAKSSSSSAASTSRMAKGLSELLPPPTAAPAPVAAPAAPVKRPKSYEERCDELINVLLAKDPKSLSAKSNRLRLVQLEGDKLNVALVKYDRAEDALDYAIDFDEEDLDDPSMCAEYAQEIIDYLTGREKFFMPSAHYIHQHADLRWDMRAILVDWLVEVHQKFKFLPETLFLCVNIMDRFLSRRVCSLTRFQLVGLAALFIAAKTEEVMCPPVSSFTFMADNAFKEADMLSAEQYILRTLEFNVWAPGPFSFIRRISKVDDYNALHRNAAKYFAEATLLDHRFLSVPPSLMAAATMYLARALNNEPGWNHDFVMAAGYSLDEVFPVALLLVDCLNSPLEGESFFSNKYAHRKFSRYLGLARAWVKQNQYDADLVAVKDAYAAKATTAARITYTPLPPADMD